MITKTLIHFSFGLKACAKLLLAVARVITVLKRVAFDERLFLIKFRIVPTHLWLIKHGRNLLSLSCFIA